MKFPIPTTIKSEHEELHGELVRATKVGGRTADAAIAVANLLHAHFLKEEEYALPPLALLPALARGEVNAQMAAVLRMTDKLEAELPTMMSEHKAVVKALGRLIEAAKAEHHPEHVRFAEKLVAHARAEEEVLYPTALLIGRYVRAMRPKARAA